MLKVTFFIKPVHAGKIILMLGKIAHELSMSPARQPKAPKPAKRGKAKP